MAKPLTYYKRCKLLGYDLRAEKITFVNTKMALWQAWFGRLPAGVVIACTSQYTREDACRELWRIAVKAGVAKEE